MSAPLSEQQLAEIRARIAGLDASRIAADSKWQAGPVDSKSILPPQTNYAVEDVGKTPHFVVRSSVAVLADQELAEFVAAARQDVPALLAEIERLRASAEGAHRRIEEALDYLATQDATQLSEDAGAMGFHIVAVLG